MKPDSTFTSSGSRRCVTKRDWPGRRRSSSAWMSASVKRMPGGMPSTTQPSAAPWLSPQVVTRKRWPNVLCDMNAVPARDWPGVRKPSIGVFCGGQTGRAAEPA